MSPPFDFTVTRNAYGLHTFFLVGQSLDGLSVLLLVFSNDLPDSDAVFGGGSDEVALGVEGEGVDHTSCVVLEGRLLQIGDVPEVELLVLATGGDVLTDWVDGDGVNLSLVRLELVTNCLVGVPNLEPAVPAHRDQVGVQGSEDGGVAELADPV